MAGAVHYPVMVKRGSTSVIVRVKIYDHGSANGHAGLTGLTSSSSGLLITTIASSGAAGSANTYSAGSSTIEGITTLGTYATPTSGKCRFAEISSTNFKGWYELQFANSVFATGNYIIITITSSVTGHAQCDIVIPLTDLDPYDVVRAGITSLPNATAGSSSGILLEVAAPSAIWQALTADSPFAIANSIGEKLKNAIPTAVAGASGGLLINGSNSGTVTLAALTISGATTHTGNVSFAAGITVTQSTTNASAISITGNGTGAGISSTGGSTGNGAQFLSGSGATGGGMLIQANSTNGTGLYVLGTGTGHGIFGQGGSTSGIGLYALGGGTGAGGLFQSGSGSTGDGLKILASSTNGGGLVITASGTGNGITSTSGSGATGDGAKFISAATNGNGLTLTSTGSGKDFNATTTPLTLAKTTNITGFNDPTVASIATGVWQDTTAGDFTVSGSIGKSLFTSGAVPGAAGGLFIAGTNAATTITTSLTTTFTGSLTGSVASVTGDVGGNVVGSVASVTARVTANVDQLNSTSIGGTGTRVADAFVAMFNVASPVFTVASVNQTGDNFARLTGTGAVTFASLTVAGTTTLTGAVTASNASNAITGVDTTKISGVTQTGGDIYATLTSFGTSTGTILSLDATGDNASGGISGVTSGTTKIGTQTGTYANTSTGDTSYHVITHSGNAIDWVYYFALGGGRLPASVTWKGYLTSSNDTMTIQAWNHLGGAWETIGTLPGTNAATDGTLSWTLLERHVGVSTAELGRVYIRFVCSGQTSPVLNTNQLGVNYAVVQNEGYTGGYIYFDSSASNTGIVPRTDGVAGKPVSSWSAVKSLITLTGLRKVDVAPGSTLTLDSSAEDLEIRGHRSTLALGGQDVGNTEFINFKSVTGTGTTTSVSTKRPVFTMCIVGSCTIPPSLIRESMLAGTITAGSAGQWDFKKCTSASAAGTTCIFTLNSTGSNTVRFSGWQGGLTLSGISSGDFIVANGLFNSLNLNGANGTVVIVGQYGTLNNNLTGTPNVVSSAAFDATLIGDIDTEVDAIKLKTDNLPSDPADASDIASSFSTVNSTLATIAGYIDTEVAAIKAKTDNLPSDPADASDIAASFSTVNSTLATIAGYIDTEVAAIKAKTDQLTFSSGSVYAVDSSGNAIAPASTALTTATWTNARAGYVDNLSAGPVAQAATALSTATWTTSRAGYLDNLNIGGPVASSANIDALNLSASRRVLLSTVPFYERPEQEELGTGTGTGVGTNEGQYTIELRTYDGDGILINADSTPVLTATGFHTGDLASKLTSASNVATGIYRWIYGVSYDDRLEEILFQASATIGGGTFTSSAFSQVVDYVAQAWTEADRTKLSAIYDKLPTKTYLTGTNNIDGDIQMNDATGDFPGSIGSLGSQAKLDVNAEVDSALADVGLTTTITGRIDVAISTRLASASYTSAPTAADIWSAATRTLTAGTNIVLAKGTGITGFNDLSAAQVNAEVDTALSDVGLSTTVTGRIDVAISTRMATFSYTAPDNASIATILGTTNKLDTALESDGLVYRFTTNALEQAPTGSSITAADVWSYGTRVLTAGTNIVLAKGTGITGFNDITTIQVRTEVDASIAATGLTSTVTGRIDVAVSTRLSAAGYTTPPTTTEIWANGTRTLTAGTNIVLAKGTGITGFNDLSASQVNAEVDSALADVGLSTTVTGRIDVAVSTRLAASAYTTPPTTTDIWSATTRTLTAGTNIVLAKGTGITGFNDLSAAQVNAEVDTAIAEVGLNTTITGRIDVAVSTRLPTTSYTSPPSTSDIWGHGTRTLTAFGFTVDTTANATELAIKERTDNLPDMPAEVGSPMTLEAGSINDAAFSMPAESPGRPTTILGIIRRLWEWATNKTERDRDNGSVKLFGHNGSTVLEERTQSTTGQVDQITEGG